MEGRGRALRPSIPSVLESAVLSVGSADMAGV